jgi:hypothetical protein
MPIITAALVSILFLSGCMFNGGYGDPSDQVKDFYRQFSMEEQKIKFKDYSLEEQYNIYLFGQRVVHPAATYLTKAFVENGSAIVPLLKSKLRVTDDDATIHEIVVLFFEIANSKLYDFSEDSDLLQMLDLKVNNMENGWRVITAWRLSDIRSSAHNDDTFSK